MFCNDHLMTQENPRRCNECIENYILIRENDPHVVEKLLTSNYVHPVSVYW